MARLAPRLTALFAGVNSTSAFTSSNLPLNTMTLSRCFSTLIRVPATTTLNSSTGLLLPSTNSNVSAVNWVPTIAVESAFHTNSSMLANIKQRMTESHRWREKRTLDYDLVPQEPRNPDEWEFRYVRFGRAQMEWTPKIPLGRPDLSAIPEGHVDRQGNPYTTEGLPYIFTDGRDQVTGYRINHKRQKKKAVRRIYRMVDYTRNVPLGENSPFVERVLEVIDDETRNPHIALVANGNFKRWILASENMKVGDLIKTYNEIPRNPVQAFEGDAYPIGALAVGTVVHNVEKIAGKGGEMACVAGAYGTILRKEGDRVIVSFYRKKRYRAIVHNQEVSVDERCMATVGRVSNVNFHLIPIGSPNMLVKLGFKQRSGWYQKKDGRFGRRIKPPPPLEEIKEPMKPYIPIHKQDV